MSDKPEIWNDELEAASLEIEGLMNEALEKITAFRLFSRDLQAEKENPKPQAEPKIEQRLG